MANKPLLYTIAAVIGVGSVANYFALAALFPDDPLFANATAASEPPSAGSSDSLADATAATAQSADNQIINQRCYMGSCGWLRVENQTIIADKPEGRLLRVSVSSASKEYPDGSPAQSTLPSDLSWSAPNASYVLCSKRMPMVISSAGELQPINVIDPPGAEENDMLFWRGVCHSSGGKGYPSIDDIALFATAIGGQKLRDPKQVFALLPSYPSWLIGSWGSTNDPDYSGSTNCDVLNHSIVWKSDHTWAGTEAAGRWMFVGGKYWLGTDPASDVGGDTGDWQFESATVQQKSANAIIVDGEEHFRCGS